MSEEYISIFQTPMTEQIPPMQSWLDKHIGFVGDSWWAKSPEVTCTQITFKRRNHKRMFDLYAELQGIAVYDTLKEYRRVQMLKWRSKVDWMDDTE